ncbi:MAG: CocE/NonD family hydrolase [Maritimibacter sp.]|nr:CocE/NonD family hydrolase [Maritimibacter sp.]
MTRWIVLTGIGVVGLGVAGLILSVVFPWNDLAWSLRDRVAWRLQAGTPDLADLRITMPDGVSLATDVYLPKGDGPVPTVLMRLPYGKRSYGEVRFWVKELRARGFAVVAQDMRGRHGSEGVFTPWANEGADGAGTLDWIVDQPWSNGRVGTLGCSALGESQLMLAARAHPAHRAMVPIGAGGAIGTAGGRNAFFGAFEGGILNLAPAAGWFGTEGGKTPEVSGFRPLVPGLLDHLPVVDVVREMRPDPTDYDAFLRHFEDTDYWRELGYVTGEEPFNTPALFIDSWHDPSVSSTLALADTLRAAGAPVNTIIAPGTHCGYLGTETATVVGDLAVTPKARFEYVETIAAFLRHHLADGPAPELPPLSYYALVADDWRRSESWPPPEAQETRLYLSGSGALEVDPEAIAPGERSFVSDPADPVPSIGGALCCTGDPDERSGPVYQNAIEDRDDLLLFTSAPLDAPLTIAGPVRAELRVSVSTPDTDLALRLVDVDPSGNALLVQEGALRLRYRDGFDRPALLQPGETYPVTIALRDIAYRFEAGHRLRLHVAGTSFPRLERNLNTGGANYDETEMRRAEITLRSTPDAPSAVVLFVTPE